MIEGQLVSLKEGGPFDGFIGVVNRVIAKDGELGGVFEVLSWGCPNTGKSWKPSKSANFFAGRDLVKI